MRAGTAHTGRHRAHPAASCVSLTTTRPALRMVLRLGGPAGSGAKGASDGARTIDSTLPPLAVPSNRISAAAFTIPRLASHPAERPASLCVTAAGLVNWGGTPLTTVPSPSPPIAGGHPLTGRIAVWYLPPAGSQRSYLSRIGEILDRASLFRPSPVGPWLYVLILFVLLPALALASVRCLALALASEGPSVRRTAAWLFAIAALNFACWALITPPFQAPDEVDHFAYTQSLVQRGEAPSRNPGSPLQRWSNAETLALEDESFFTDHQVGDSRAPWTSRQQDEYHRQAAAEHPQLIRRRRQRDGRHARRDLLRGARARLPARLQLAVLAADADAPHLRADRSADGRVRVLDWARAGTRPTLVGGARGAARRLSADVRFHLRRGQQRRWCQRGCGCAGAAADHDAAPRGHAAPGVCSPGRSWWRLPVVKGTAYSLYPVAVVALVATLWRHHRRDQISRLERSGGHGACATRDLGALRARLSPGCRELEHAAWSRRALWARSAKRSRIRSATSPTCGRCFLPRLPFMARHLGNHELPRLRDLRRTRLGCVRLV